MARYRVIVSGHEFVCAKRRSDTSFFLTGDANIQAHIAVTVAILDKVPEPNLHIAFLYAVISSHGFTAASLLGSAVNASSSCNLSHTVRELMRLGTGIRPSLTSASNSDGEMPT
jgi:hypothetical protein